MRPTALLLLTSAFLLAVPVDSLDDPAVPDIFFPFGADEGDNVVPVADDVSSPAVGIPTGFPFLHGNYSTVYVGDDGFISIDALIRTQYTPRPLPISSPPTPFIAVYWADVDTTKNNGRIYYRQTADYATLVRATRDVHAQYPSFTFFSASSVFIATWHNVTFLGATATPYPVNTFQAVLITDGAVSFVMFNYGNLAWTTGVWSGGNPIDGLGGNPAGVGFNKGDGVVYYEHPLSITPAVLYINSQTNCRAEGRWMYRVDGANGTCYLPPIIANTPMITGCPLLVGPTVVNRTQIEFYCEVKTNETDPRALYKVFFLFDYEVDAGVPFQILSFGNLTATLHERYLAGRLNKVLSCSVTSYFDDTPSQQSRMVYSERSFRPEVRASLPELVVDESDPGPARLVLYSNLPITCQGVHRRTNSPLFCWVTFALSSNENIAMRQRVPGTTTIKHMCTYRLYEEDWKPAEQNAYDGNRSLDIVAKVDLPVTRPRLSKIEFTFQPELGDYKTINGETYLNPWFNYTLRKPVLVYRYDSPAPLAQCNATGDPHSFTFDGLYYHIYTKGNFIYVRNLSYPAVEVQVRHWACTQWTRGVSCVCGVAMREGDVILVANRCRNDSDINENVKYFTYNAKNLPDDARITVNDAGNRFKMQMPSGNKIIGQIYSQVINIYIYISKKTLTEGLCGSADGIRSNDLFHRSTRAPATFINGVIDDSTAASWRVTDRKEDLFIGNKAPELPNPDSLNETLRGFCLCDGTERCGRKAVSDTTADDSEPQQNVLLGVPVWANIFNRRKKREASTGGGDASTGNPRTYYINYNPQFDDNSDEQKRDAIWPAPGNISELEAKKTCRAIILNTSYIGQSCFDKLGDDDSSTEIVQSCVTDVQLTGDFSWAESQVATMQQECVDDILMSNYTELNDTEALNKMTKNLVNEFNDFKCEPFNCNNNGVCDKGSCSCNPGYIDVDCGIRRDAVPSVDGLLATSPCCSMDCTGDDCPPTQDRCAELGLLTTDAISKATCRFDVNTGDTNTTVGWRIGKDSTTCPLPTEALQVHDRHLNFTEIRPADFNFTNLPLGGASQNYTVSVSNNGLDFGSSQTYTLYNKTCMSCSSSGLVQKPNTCVINGYCFVTNDSNPYADCLKCLPRQSTTSWTPADFPCPEHSEVKFYENGTCYCDVTDCVTWTIQDDYGGFGDRSSAATTVDECRAECSNTGGCTAIDWVAGLSPRSQCWLVGFWTTWSGDRPGIQRHTMSNRCVATSTEKTASVTTAGCETWTIQDDYGGFGDRSSTATTVEDCQTECSNNGECTAIDWVAALSSGSQCWLVGPWTTWSGARPGIQRHSITRTCVVTSTERTAITTTPADCETWTVQDDYGGFDDRSSTATTVEDCRTECSNNVECTAIDWVAGLSTGSQCWLVGPWTTSSVARTGIQRHSITRTCNASVVCSETWTIQNDYGGLDDRSSTATSIGDCRTECSNNVECTAIDWVGWLSTGSQCWLVGPWTTWNGDRAGIHRHTISRTCGGCVSWTVQDDYGGYDDRSSTATTVEECRTECRNNNECTAIDWVAGLSTGSQCWLVGPWTTWSGYRPGLQRHFISRTCG